MNKPRLIDANKLLDCIEENSYTLVDRINSKDKGMFLVGIKEAIDKTPTAYDIDKVVERLCEIEVHRNEYSETVECNIEPCRGMNCYECIVDRAIEIVKGGGDE